MTWTPQTVIALSIIACCMLLMVFKIDGEVKGVFCMAAGWTFNEQYHATKNGGS